MQEDGQLTDRSLQATLSIAADAITSAVLAGKGVDSVYASELLVMTARGLQLPTAALGTTSSPTGRRLLQAQGGFVATATAGDRNDLLGTLDSLADLLDESAGPAIGWISAYGQGPYNRQTLTTSKMLWSPSLQTLSLPIQNLQCAFGSKW
jgi:hypothetical protein